MEGEVRERVGERSQPQLAGEVSGRRRGGQKRFYQARRRLKPALQLNDAAADADRHRLRAILGAEFVHDVLDMDLDGLLRNE